MKINKSVTVNGVRFSGRQLRKLAIEHGTPTRGAWDAVVAQAQWEGKEPDTPFEQYVTLNTANTLLTFRRLEGYFQPVASPEEADVVEVKFLDLKRDTAIVTLL